MIPGVTARTGVKGEGALRKASRERLRLATV